jgi:hypothetical protein
MKAGFASKHEGWPTKRDLTTIALIVASVAISVTGAKVVALRGVGLFRGAGVAVAEPGLLRGQLACSEIVPEIDRELGAGLGEREEGVATIAAVIAAGAAADFTSSDVGADVVFRAVGVQRDFGTIEDL